MWARFYNHGKNTIYKSMDKKYKRHKEEDKSRFWKTSAHTYIDLYKLATRLYMINSAILQEGNSRALAEKKMAYIIIDKNSEFGHSCI